MLILFLWTKVNSHHLTSNHTHHFGMFSEVVRMPTSGADPGFEVRGGALKKIVPSEGRHENF